jgi:hypothetical protein
LQLGGDTLISETADTYHYGYYWQALDNTSIQVVRQKDDYAGLQLRVRIWVVTNVDFDSGWVHLSTKETRTLDHKLGGDPDDYVVDMEFKASNIGINKQYYGLNTSYSKSGGDTLQEWGANWHGLTNQSINVYRGEHEFQAYSVRVRIWRVTDVNFDSGWQTIVPGGQVFLSHNLGGPWNDFYVDLQFKHNGAGNVHQIYYGGDIEAHSGNIYDRGAWFESLDSSHVIVSRAAEDTLVHEVRVRIWENPTPKYDSGWQAIAKGETITLNHNLKGFSDFYFVDLQSKDSISIAQDGYGVNH